MQGFRDVILESGGLGAVLVPSPTLLGFGAVFTAFSVWRCRFEDTKVYG